MIWSMMVFGAVVFWCLPTDFVSKLDLNSGGVWFRITYQARFLTQWHFPMYKQMFISQAIFVDLESKINA